MPTKPKHHLTVSTMPHGEGKAIDKFQAYLNKKGLRGSWKTRKSFKVAALILVLLLPGIPVVSADQAHITISMEAKWLQRLLGKWACTRIDCTGKTHSQIAYEAIDIFMKRESKGFIGWNLESLGATVEVKYDK